MAKPKKPKVTCLLQGERLLEDVKNVADPIQRGDQPYYFTAAELLTAFDQAVAIYTYAYGRLEKVDNPAEYRVAELLSAGSYVATLARALQAEIGLTLRRKKQISATNKVIAGMRQAIGAKLSRLPVPELVRE